jgi:flagellum-specific ATP synthase
MPIDAETLLLKASQAISGTDSLRANGIVEEAVGLVVRSRGPSAGVGELCHVETAEGDVPAEVVGFSGEHTLLMPLGEMRGVKPDCRIRPAGIPLRTPSGNALLGRVLDGLGRPIDSKGIPHPVDWSPLEGTPPAALDRTPIREQLTLGVRALDGLLPCGKGQRIGIFAGSGVGKSSLLGMIARATTADVNVICLVGERGREVREFIENDLGPEGLARSVIVVATSDEPALVRVKATQTATAIAEGFRRQGKDVLLMMDSLTRFALAQREIGLAIGEPPTTRGFTPSVFAMLPKLLERAGTDKIGSITGIYTVLVEGSDMEEPVADHARSILDGHVVLTRDLAQMGHFPSIDVLQSISRLEPAISPKDVQLAAREVRKRLAVLRRNEELLLVGAYEAGSDADVDLALATREAINDYLRQDLDTPSTLEEARAGLIELSLQGTFQPNFTPLEN